MLCSTLPELVDIALENLAQQALQSRPTGGLIWAIPTQGAEHQLQKDAPQRLQIILLGQDQGVLIIQGAGAREEGGVLYAVLIIYWHASNNSQNTT